MLRKDGLTDKFILEFVRNDDCSICDASYGCEARGINAMSTCGEEKGRYLYSDCVRNIEKASESIDDFDRAEDALEALCEKYFGECRNCPIYISSEARTKYSCLARFMFSEAGQ